MSGLSTCRFSCDAGASIVPIVAFLTTLTMVGIVTFPLEKKEFGTKFTIIRNSCFIFAITIVLIMGVILRKITQFIKNKFLTLILLIYIILFILMPNKAITSLKNSFYYVKEMLMIMPVILLLTALITAWVPKKAIEKNLGSNSGFKGSIFSFLLGSFSAGPIYAAFPVCKTLFEKGASISNIVILLSTWAVVKIPMLLTEFKFLGPKFMIARWILTTISIFIMGYITSKLVKQRIFH